KAPRKHGHRELYYLHRLRVEERWHGRPDAGTDVRNSAETADGYFDHQGWPAGNASGYQFAPQLHACDAGRPQQYAWNDEPGSGPSRSHRKSPGAAGAPGSPSKV